MSTCILLLKRPASLAALCVCLWALQSSPARAVDLVNKWTITLPPSASVPAAGAPGGPVRIDAEQQKFDLLDSFSSFAAHTYRFQLAANANTGQTQQYFNTTLKVTNTTGNSPFGGFTIDVTDLNAQSKVSHIFPQPGAVEHPDLAHVHPRALLTDNTFSSVAPTVPDNLGTRGMRVFGSDATHPGRLVAGATWVRTLRLHDGVVNPPIETAFTVTLSPSGLQGRTVENLTPFQPRTLRIVEPDTNENTSEMQDFILLSFLWREQGDTLLFEPNGELSDVIRFVNVPNGIGGALTANIFFGSDKLDPAEMALLPTLPAGSFLRGFTEDGIKTVSVMLTDGGRIKADLFSDLDPASTNIPSDAMTLTVIPEPATWALLTIGLPSLVALARRKKLPRPERVNRACGRAM